MFAPYDLDLIEVLLLVCPSDLLKGKSGVATHSLLWWLEIGPLGKWRTTMAICLVVYL